MIFYNRKSVGKKKLVGGFYLTKGECCAILH